MLDFFNIYLPIADVSINALVLILIGIGVGTLSGIFGIGGGFIITPLLFFLGVPPNIAVATSANQVLATATASTLLQRKAGQIDYKIGNYMLAGGIVSVMIGSLLFASLRALGQVDLFLRLSYIGFLLFVGMLIWRESFSSISIRKGKKFWHHYIKIPVANTMNLKFKTAIDLSPMSLPFSWGNNVGKKFLKTIKTRVKNLPSVEYFPISNIKVSIWLPVILGGAIGFFSSILGVGGSIIAIPFMTYVLKMPTRMVIGTSLYQVVFISALTSLMQSMLGRSLDIVLSVLLTMGGLAGASLGNKLSNKLSPDVLRFMFSCLVLFLALILLFGLFIRPKSLFLLSIITP